MLPMIINMLKIFNIHSSTSLIIVNSSYTALVSNRLEIYQYNLCSAFL